MKVSIIIPFYNAEKFLSESINSVLAQDYEDWELILVDDGSTDDSEEIARSFDDPRIRLYKQENGGVSNARNLGLTKMTGEYFCFLDADDLMTKESISIRIDEFKDDKIAFVGGGQKQMTEDLSRTMIVQTPSYKGNSKEGLIRLDPKCFVNCGTWLIKRDLNRKYRFPEGWTHSEDLAFFLSVSDQGDLVSIPDVVQIYRRHDSSAMSNLELLEQGYWQFYEYANIEGFITNNEERNYLKRRIMRIMFLSYLSEWEVGKALGTLLIKKE